VANDVAADFTGGSDDRDGRTGRQRHRKIGELAIYLGREGVLRESFADGTGEIERRSNLG